MTTEEKERLIVKFKARSKSLKKAKRAVENGTKTIKEAYVDTGLIPNMVELWDYTPNRGWVDLE